MTDDEKTQDAADQSAFAGDAPPHQGAEEDASRPSDGELTTEELAEGGPAGA
jgi:hypothetical protein